LSEVSRRPACLPAPSPGTALETSIRTLLGAIADTCVVNQRFIIKKERGLVSRAMEEYNCRWILVVVAGCR